MNNYIFAAIVFFLLVIIIEMLLYAWRASRDLHRSRKVVERLQDAAVAHGMGTGGPDTILKTRSVSAIPFLNSLLLKINVIERLENLVKQAAAPLTPAVYLLAAALLGVLGFMAGQTMLHATTLGLLLGFVCFLLPFAWLNLKKRLRLQKFAVQLPDALDLVARSLKAGHSFSSGLKLAAENFPDPIGEEFMATIREINFGLPVAEALKNLGKRVDSADLNFFIVATILQRETGGNLAEITENIAAIIRERFKFEDKVRVLAAEGKISAVILIGLPFVMFFLLLRLSPEYIDVLLNDPIGRKAGIAAIVLMLAGILTITKMIRIKV